VKSWRPLSVYFTVLLLLVSPGCLLHSSIQSNKANALRKTQHNVKPHSEGGTSYQSFEGQWSYATNCNFGHYVGITLNRTTDGGVIGDWDDGSNLRGWSGKLKGTVRGDKLYVRYCSLSIEDNYYKMCPDYEEESDYFARHGDHLVWNKRSGSKASGYKFSEYVVLSRSRQGTQPQYDNYCGKDVEDMP